MKYPFLCTVYLILAIVAVFAGCTGSPAVPSTGTPGQIKISQLALTPAEIPIRVESEESKNPDLSDPVLSDFGAIQGYTRIYQSEKTESPASASFIQTIVDYPAGNAAPAFASFVNLTRQGDQSQFKITWMPDPGIGEQSCAFIVFDRSGTDKPRAMIIFVKSDIMESIVMMSPSVDMDALTRSARTAAAKIP